MKNLFRTFTKLTLAVIAGAALALAPKANAQLYGTTTLMNGGTNNVAASTTNSYGTTLQIDCTQRNNIGISVGGAALQSTNTGTINFVFKQSLDGTTNTTETTPTYVIPLTLNGTSFVVTTTNITVNAVGYLYLDSVRNPYATAETNLTANWSQKPGRSLY